MPTDEPTLRATGGAAVSRPSAPGTPLSTATNRAGLASPMPSPAIV